MTDDGPTSARVLRQRIHEQLGDLESIVHQLNTRLADDASKSDEARAERRVTQDLEVRAALLNAQRRDAEARWTESLAEQRKLERERDALTESNARLRARLTEVEEALAGAERRESASQAEVECLMEQVTELRSIIDLLLRRAGV